MKILNGHVKMRMYLGSYKVKFDDLRGPPSKRTTIVLQRCRHDIKRGGAWSLRWEISSGKNSETFYFLKKV